MFFGTPYYQIGSLWGWLVIIVVLGHSLELIDILVQCFFQRHSSTENEAYNPLLPRSPFSYHDDDDDGDHHIQNVYGVNDVLDNMKMYKFFRHQGVYFSAVYESYHHQKYHHSEHLHHPHTH